MKLKTFIGVSVVSFGIFSWANYSSWSPSVVMNEEEVSGKQVWQTYNCVSCHTLFGNGGYVGSDLTFITRKRTEEELLEFFRNPPILPPNKKRQHIALSDEEAILLVRYFEYLNQVPTLGWPPKPIRLDDGGSL